MSKIAVLNSACTSMTRLNEASMKFDTQVQALQTLFDQGHPIPTSELAKGRILLEQINKNFHELGAYLAIRKEIGSGN